MIMTFRELLVSREQHYRNNIRDYYFELKGLMYLHLADEYKLLIEDYDSYYKKRKNKK